MIPLSVYDTEDGYAIGVYACIAKFANREGEAFPSIATIAKQTGWARTTVKKALRLLESIEVVRTRQNPGRSSFYELIDHPSATATRSPRDLQVVATRPTPGRHTTTNYNVEQNVVTTTPSESITDELIDVPKPYDVYERWCRLVGIEPGRMPGRDAANAKELIACGTVADDVEAQYAWLKAQPFWKDKTVTLGVMLSQQSAWRAWSTTQITNYVPVVKPVTDAVKELEDRIAYLSSPDCTEYTPELRAVYVTSLEDQLAKAKGKS